MRKPDSTLNAVKTGALVGFGLLGLATAGASSADTPGDGSETYTWSAELVEFDAANDSATVKARVVGEAEDVQTSSLSEGDEAMLTWSGISYGAGVRALEPGHEASFDRMTLPVAFVAAEDDGHLVFRVQVPAADADALAELEPGEWVTATSPQAGNATEAVLSMRPYGDVE